MTPPGRHGAAVHGRLTAADAAVMMTGVAPGGPGRVEGDSVPHIICEPCIGTKDQACVDVCPVECIYEADDQFYIHPEECIDCGACVPACPVSAIYPEEDVAEDQTAFIKKNYDLSGV